MEETKNIANLTDLIDTWWENSLEPTVAFDGEELLASVDLATYLDEHNVSIELPLETVRSIIRMAALVVMEEIGDVDKALATAISAKAALDLQKHLQGRK